MKRVLVTGATGFIGSHLVRQLVAKGDEVTCLIRPTSRRDLLRGLDVRFNDRGLEQSAAELRSSVGGFDVVYHLAGTTKTLRPSGFEPVNVDAVGRLAKACAAVDTPPTFVHVSSLAAAGPSRIEQAKVETDPATPVSNYGRSKLAGEHRLRQFSDSLPSSIIRPPIVLGPADRDGLEMFQSIARWGTHLVPGFRDNRFSVIHVEDLCRALLLVAEQGKRLRSNPSDSTGLYFAAAEEAPSYAGLGEMIARALGRKRLRIVRSPFAVVWTISAVGEAVSRLRGRPHILNLDKAREATAGSWSCSAEKLKQQTGFQPLYPLQERIDQITRWYLDEGWLSTR